MIEWNHLHGIKVFRISSELFPHYTNLKSPCPYTLDFAQDLLSEAGRLAKMYNQRLTFHPGQYNVIATPNRQAWENTVRDLDMHAEILDRLDAGDDSVMVVHGGGMYGNKESTKTRWVERFFELPTRVQKRLVLENCEKCFHIGDCLEISERIKETSMTGSGLVAGIPVVFDTHHYECYKIMHSDEVFEPAENYIQRILETWSRRGIKPKFHVSEQYPNGRIGKHSDYISEIPKYLLDIPERFDQSIDIMIEAKLKERAIFKLYLRHPELDPRPAQETKLRIKVPKLKK